MKRRRLALTSIVAALSLLAFVFSAWMKPLSHYSPQQISHSERIYNFVPTSASVQITAVKPRLTGFTGGATASITTFQIVLPQLRKFGLFDCNNAIAASALRPLWLLNRSLLI